MTKGHSKGSSYEREICKLLSMWWSNNERDDIFWRTSISGGRAKTRQKAGKKTFGQYGDIQATDPIGQPLIDLCLIEIKRGYGLASCMDEMDRKGKKESIWGEWFSKMEKDIGTAKIPFWILIVKRNRKKALIFLPRSLRQILVRVSPGLSTCLPSVLLNLKGKHIYGTTLENFLKYVSPETIEKLSSEATFQKVVKGLHPPRHVNCRCIQIIRKRNGG